MPDENGQVPVLNPADRLQSCERCGAEFAISRKSPHQRFCSKSCANSRPHRKRPEGERFWAKVRKTHGCWTWIGSITPAGYGQFSTADWRLVAAHRWSWEQIHGPVPDGLELDHLCRNRACVRPDHLEAVTRSVNVQRGLQGDLKPPTPLREFCANGHRMAVENTYPRRDGVRGKYGCRQCSRDSSRRYYARTRGTA